MQVPFAKGEKKYLSMNMYTSKQLKPAFLQDSAYLLLAGWCVVIRKDRRGVGTGGLHGARLPSCGV